MGPAISLSVSGPQHSIPHQVTTMPGAHRQPSPHPAAPRNLCHGSAGSAAPVLRYSHQHSPARCFSRAQLTPQQPWDFPLHQSSLTSHSGSKNKSSARTRTFLYLLLVQPSPPLCSTLPFNDIFAQAYRIALAIQLVLLICSSLPATIPVPCFKDREDTHQLPAADTRHCTFGQYLNTAPKPVSPVFPMPNTAKITGLKSLSSS